MTFRKNQAIDIDGRLGLDERIRNRAAQIQKSRKI